MRSRWYLRFVCCQGRLPAKIGDCTRKRKREAELPSVKQATVKWLKQCRDGDARISGPMLQEKAEIYAKTLGHDDFRASNVWLRKFKQRNGVVFRKVCGESADVNNETCDDWKEKLQTLTQDYTPDDIFNADELGLIFFLLFLTIS